MDETLNEYKTSSHENGNNLSVVDVEQEFPEEFVFNKTTNSIIAKLKNKFSIFLRKINKGTNNILFVTTDSWVDILNSKNNSIISYVTSFNKQYPEVCIRIIVPIVEKVKDFDKRVLFSFDYELQNKTHTAEVIELPTNRYNIKFYGIYSTRFKNIKGDEILNDLELLVHYCKILRSSVNKMIKARIFNIDIVHCNNIPYFMGSELEDVDSISPKVILQIEDFSQTEIDKVEPLFALIQMANKKILKRICTDKIIRKGFALLFGLHNIDSSSQMYSCLNQIYQDSSKLKELTDKLENKESIIEKLNNRVLKMFPLIKQGDSKYYNKFYSSIKSANFWYVNSKSYFDTITKTPSLTGSIEDLLKNNSGDFLESGFDLDKHKNRNDIYQPFNEENFRELRVNNKFYLLKEFSKERIQSKFISSNLFSTPDYELKGYLNTLSDVSLIFVQFKPNVFCQGIDIAFNNIIKLLNSSQKIKFIINIDNGLSEPFINHWINYLEQNTNYSGRWVYINTPINLPQFLAGSDLILLPNRTNVCNDLHYLSLYYGCIPVANSNGLYNDTIIDIFDNIAQGNGFKTKINLLREEKADELFAETLKKALQLYNNNSASWNLIIKNAMNYNSSWNFRKIEKFNRLYEKI